MTPIDKAWVKSICVCDNCKGKVPHFYFPFWHRLSLEHHVVLFGLMSCFFILFSQRSVNELDRHAVVEQDFKADVTWAMVFVAEVRFTLQGRDAELER